MFGKGGSRCAPRARTGASDAALEGLPQTDLSLFQPAGVHQHSRRRLSSRLFQECVKSAGCAIRSTPFTRPIPTPAFFGLYTAPIPATLREMMEVIVDVINDAVETLTEAEIARAKAQMKAGLLMALESCSSRAEHWRGHAGYGRPLTVAETDDPDRRRQHGIERTPRADCCRAAGPLWSRSAAAGGWTRRSVLRKD